MLTGFLDDTEIVVDGDDPTPDIFIFGGFFVRQAYLVDLQRRIAEVKVAYGLPWYAPVKWNMKDKGLQEFYSPDYMLNPDLAVYLRKISDDLRQDLLALLEEFDAKVLISGRYDISRNPATHSDYYAWAFENLLQRVGLMAQGLREQGAEVTGTTLVVDWPQRGIDKSLFNLYYGGYHFGRGLESRQDYFSGPLRQYHFAESLVHGSTLHSGPLQLADLVVGCCRDFLAWAIKGTKIQKIQGIFDLLIPLFYRDAQGRLNGCGFKVAKANNLDIEAKIDEFQQKTRPAPEDVIPF